MYKCCKYDECDRRYYAKGYCSLHYKRFRKWGDASFTARNNKTKHELYPVWASMKDRCSREAHPRYARYGGRGITVCDRWLGYGGFDNFLADMGERPKDARYTLERRDNDKGYSPDNCYWATYKEQNTNRDMSGRKLQREHGTTNMYKFCRCELCKKAHSNYCKMRYQMTKTE